MVFAAISLAVMAWFWVLYYPPLVGPGIVLGIENTHHCIRYL